MTKVLEQETKIINGQYRIWRFHYDSPAILFDPDTPDGILGEADPFYQLVDSFEQAIAALKMLQAYDNYQQEYRDQEPNDCDCYGLEIWLNGEWVEWKSEECENIQQYIEGSVVYVLGRNA